MNQKIKKFLCQYFSSDDEDKKVTLGTLIVWSIFYIIIGIILILALYSVYLTSLEIYNCTQGIACFNETEVNNHVIAISVGILIIMVIIFVLGFNLILLIMSSIIYIMISIVEFIYNKLLKKLFSIEITKCDKKD